MNPRLPYGFMNSTQRVGNEVVKTYTGADSVTRMRAEVTALCDVAELIGVPEVLGVRVQPPTIRLRFVEGRNAADLLNERPSASGAILYSLGAFVRDFQHSYRTRGGGMRPMRVHGDCGPQNFILHEDWSVTALVDWEWSRAGAAVTDIAWLEWIVRRHYPEATIWLGELYAGYGTIPPWSIRHEAMTESCAGRAEAAARGSHRPTIERWHQHLEATRAMKALVE